MHHIRHLGQLGKLYCDNANVLVNAFVIFLNVSYLYLRARRKSKYIGLMQQRIQDQFYKMFIKTDFKISTKIFTMNRMSDFKISTKIFTMNRMSGGVNTQQHDVMRYLQAKMTYMTHPPPIETAMLVNTLILCYILGQFDIPTPFLDSNYSMQLSFSQIWWIAQH